MLYGRNEEKTLPRTLATLINQGFDYIIYVDDCSRDNSIKIAEKFGLIVVKRTIPHKSYVGKALLSKVVNEGITEIYHLPRPKYFMITGCDIRLSADYTHTIIERMERDPLLVIASGKIENEKTTFSSPRGAGRIYRFTFWDQYLKTFPLSYTWESYPVYLALSLGYKTRSFSDVQMVTSRPTTPYKAGYGYAMGELGYSRIYALARCLFAVFQDRRTGVTMLKAYLFSGLPVFNEDVARWIKRYQITTIFQSLKAKLASASRSSGETPVITSRITLANRAAPPP